MYEPRLVSALSSARRERILDAAEAVFLAVGYVDANMSEVIRRAGGSKATLYKHFGDKEGLFAAVIHRIASKMLNDVQVAVAGAEDSPEAFLVTFSEEVTNFLLQPECLFVARALLTDGHRFPSLAKAFDRVGNARILQALEQRFAAWKAAGLVDIGDPADAAADFQDLLTTGVMMRSMFKQVPPPSALEVAARARRLVRVYLSGVAARA